MYLIKVVRAAEYVSLSGYHIRTQYANGYEVSIDNVVYESISKAADSLRIGHETARMRFKSKSFPNYRILSR
jgi:hypothetical protein